MSSASVSTDVLIVGGGPSGSVAGGFLAARGVDVLCLERGYFPRFVIGESLLPRCNALLEEAGFLEAVKARNYLVKPGAAFKHGDKSEYFDFSEAMEGDYPDTFQVPRDDFDQTLAVQARAMGLDLRFGHQVEDVSFGSDGATATVTDLEAGTTYTVKAAYVMDCSGYGRVLPRLLDLEVDKKDLPSRVSCFMQIEGDHRPEGAREGEIWICRHPENGWIWIIPFSNGRTSIGGVCDPEVWEALAGSTPRSKLFTFLRGEPNTAERIRDAVPVNRAQVISGYSQKVAALHGDRWCLVGNASDFLDPIFSSGITLALETCLQAAKLAERTVKGEAVDWDTEYDAVVAKAVGVFLVFIEAWYDGRLLDVFFAKTKSDRVKANICSILAGHVLRDDNTFVNRPAEAFDRLHTAVSRSSL
jgi:flavin-dependent dehydrogenase